MARLLDAGNLPGKPQYCLLQYQVPYVICSMISASQADPLRAANRREVSAQVASRLNLNSKGAGSVTLRVTSHDHPKLGWSLLVPVVGALWGKLRGEDGAF